MRLFFFSTKKHYVPLSKRRGTYLCLPASVAHLDAPSDWRTGGRGFKPRRGRQHSFVEFDHEIISTVILSLSLIQEGLLSVSGERMCTILVNHMTPLGWLGRIYKTSTQRHIYVHSPNGKGTYCFLAQIPSALELASHFLVCSISCEPVVGFLPNFHGYINRT